MSHAGAHDQVGGVQSPLALRSGKHNLCVYVVVDVDGAYDGSIGAYFPNLITIFHVLIRLALLLAKLNNDGMGGLEI